MTKTLTLTIDGNPVSVPEGTTLLDAVRLAGADAPTICFSERTTPNAICRQCVVEVQGWRVLVASCVAQAQEGMVVQTRSPRVERARRTILEMLASGVDLSEAPEIQAQMDDYQADPQRFPEAERRSPPPVDDNPMYIRDYAKCVLCWRCVQVCADDAQYTYAINFTGRGYETQIGTFFDKPMPATSCVFCGQCVAVCPSGALKPKRAWLYDQGLSLDDIRQQVRPQKTGKP